MGGGGIEERRRKKRTKFEKENADVSQQPTNRVNIEPSAFLKVRKSKARARFAVKRIIP